MIKEKIEQANLAKQNPSKCFYVYVHKRLTTGEPFYVGKGKAYRAWNKASRSKYWKRIVSKHGVSVDLVGKELEEHSAHSLEIYTIKTLKDAGYVLCNHTEGGEGVTGLKWSEDMREKYRKSAASRSVFIDMKLILTGRPVMPYSRLAKILGVHPSTLCKTKEYGMVPREAVLRSAAKRRGKPTWNAGKSCPETSGVNNNFADKNIYSFIRLADGYVFTGTRYDLCEKFLVTRAQVGKLFTNEPRKTSMGWALLKETNGS